MLEGVPFEIIFFVIILGPIFVHAVLQVILNFFLYMHIEIHCFFFKILASSCNSLSYDFVKILP